MKAYSNLKIFSTKILRLTRYSESAMDLCMNCKHCEIPMLPGTALVSTFVGHEDLGGVVTMSPGGPGKLVPVWKCPECGYSVRGGFVECRPAKSVLDIVDGGGQVAKGKTLLEIFREGKL
jgi:hypothetical protein